MIHKMIHSVSNILVHTNLKYSQMCEDRLGSEKNSEPCQMFAIKLSNKNGSLTIIEKSSIIDVLNKPVVSNIEQILSC